MSQKLEFVFDLQDDKPVKVTASSYEEACELVAQQMSKNSCYPGDDFYGFNGQLLEAHIYRGVYKLISPQIKGVNC